jgi:uncharacterized protein (TIGR00299 family) protein
MIGWLDCSAGASGDMVLGAFVDAGVPLAVLQVAIDSLGTEPVVLRPETVHRHGIAGLRVHVECAESSSSRPWAELRRLLGNSALTATVRELAMDVFGRLAAAEAGVHGVDTEAVIFHEVGGLDAIADIVGACAAYDWLRRERGLTTVTASAVALGSGTAQGMHGVIPIPGPAVLALLAGAPVYAGPARSESCTPTGAALLATFVDSFGPLPAMTLGPVGCGAGSRDIPEVPNLLRLVLGEPSADRSTPTAVLLEANVDDLDPRVWPAVLAALFDAGASDAWLSPIAMKKGRAAHTLHVLCGSEAVERVRRTVFLQSSTIGIRQSTVDKIALHRSLSTVDVEGEPIRVKTAFLDGAVVNVSVEYDDVVAAATALGLPVKVVLARATSAAQP